MKRTQYLVTGLPRNEIARFSTLTHAQIFSRIMSRLAHCHLEIAHKTGLVGQYFNGNPTPEFIDRDSNAAALY